MPFAPHFRVSAIGRLGNPEADRFTFSLNMANLGGVIENLPLDFGIWGDIADDIQVFFARPSTLISSNANLQFVKIARIGPTGAYAEKPPLIFPRGAFGAAVPPAMENPASSIAISLNTNRIDPTGRGRFYLPLPSVTTDPSDGFRFSIAQAEGIRASCETLVEQLNDQPGLDAMMGGNMQVVVASSKGYNTPVSSVRVGRVVDVVRSRRNKIPEMYTANAGV